MSILLDIFTDMFLTRFQFALLGILSVFTAIIAPIATIDGKALPLPFSNLRIVGLFLLFLLLSAFFSSLFSKWKLYHGIVFCIILTIIFLGISIPFGIIRDTHGGGESIYYSWGWIFFLGGIVFFVLGQYGGETLKQQRLGLLGISGALFFLIFTSIIAYVSIAYNQTHIHESVLFSYFSPEVKDIAGLWMSPPIESLKSVTFDRVNNMLAFSTRSETGTRIYFGKGILHNLNFTGARGVDFSFYGGDIFSHIASLDDGYVVYRGTGKLLEGPIILPIQDLNGKVLSWISYAGDGWIWKNVKGNTRFIEHTGTDEPIIVTSAGIIRVIASRSGALWQITRDGKSIGSDYLAVHSIMLSHNEHDMIALVRRGGNYIIVKDGETIFTLPVSFLRDSLRSNGSDFLYETRKNNYREIHWNGAPVSGLYEDIGPSFVFPNKSGYAFFGRSLGEREWCLYMTGKKPFCGLEGFMNPIIAADGTSVLYAGLRNGIWSLYRDTDIIVRSTNYTPHDNSYDYFYIDTAVPTNYVFFIYDPFFGTYRINHNGTLLPQAWSGIGEAVWFGYDNRVITSVKYDDSWRIIEIYAPPFR